MSEFDPWLRFLLAVLATWRLTHLIAREDGPGRCLARLRGRLGVRILKIFVFFHRYARKRWRRMAATLPKMRTPRTTTTLIES